MLSKLLPRARLIPKPSFLVVSEVLQDLSVDPVRHLRNALNFSGTDGMYDTILKAGKESHGTTSQLSPRALILLSTE
jgi:hypothetical protein